MEHKSKFLAGEWFTFAGFTVKYIPTQNQVKGIHMGELYSKQGYPMGKVTHITKSRIEVLNFWFTRKAIQLIGWNEMQFEVINNS